MHALKELKKIDCLHCKAKQRTTFFVRHHPFIQNGEIRRCESCKKESLFSTNGKEFNKVV